MSATATWFDHVQAAEFQTVGLGMLTLGSVIAAISLTGTALVIPNLLPGGSGSAVEAFESLKFFLSVTLGSTAVAWCGWQARSFGLTRLSVEENRRMHETAGANAQGLHRVLGWCGL